MAGGNDERVNLLISAAVDGLKNVEGLIGDLQELEKSGRVELPDNSEGLREGLGKTSEEMRGLAERLTKLREQQGLVTQFAELKRETKELAEQQQSAKARATELGKALSETEKPARAQVQEFERAKKAAKGADDAWISNNRQLNELRGELDGAGVSTKDLAGEQVRIRKEIDGVNREASEMSDELREIKDSAEGAGKGTKKAAQGAEDLGDKAKRSSGLISKLGSGLKALATGAAALVAGIGASAATLTIFSRSQASLADELTNTSNAIGVNREALQVWQIAGERVGLTGEKVTDILRSVTERLGEFSATGGGEAAQVMERLNLQMADFEGLAPDEQMLRFAEAIQSIPKAEQVALLEKLGSDASQLQPLLDNNAAGLRAIAEEAQKDGAIYTDAELDRLNKANDVYNSIDLKLKALTTRIGAKLAPAVGQATEKVLELFNSSGAGDKLVELFSRATDAATDFFESLLKNQDSIGSGFQTLVDTVQFLGNGVIGVFRSVQAVAAGVTTVVAGVLTTSLTLAAKVTQGLNALGIVGDEAYNKLQAKADAAAETTAALAKETVEYGKKAIQAGVDAANAFDNTEKAAKQAGEEIDKTVATLEPYTEVMKTAGEVAEEALQKQQRATKSAREGLSQYGIDVKEVMTGISTEAQKAIDDVGKMAAQIQKAGLNSEEAALAFRDGFSNAIEAVDSRKGLIALQEKIRGLKEAGEIGAEGANKGLETIRVKLAELRGEDVDLGLEDISEDSKEAVKGIDEVKNKTKQAAEEAEKAREKFRSTWGAAFAKAISNAREQVTALSTAARNLFEMKIGGNAFVNEAESAAESLERARQRTEELASARRRLMSNSFAAWFADTALAAAQVTQQFYEQATAMETLQEKIESGTFSMDQLANISSTAANKFDLLDNQRLNGLQQAIDAARSKMESLNATAESTLNSLRQRLADIQGDTEEAQRLQFEAERKRLQQQLDQARQAGADNAAADYAKALEQLEKINQIEQQNRREAENERERAAAERQRQQQQAERDRQRADRELNQPRTPATTQPSSPTQRIELNLPTGGAANLSGDPESVNNLLEFLSQSGLRTTE